MTTLPPDLGRGKVVARLIEIVGDSDDEGRDPDAQAPLGVVRITPRSPFRMDSLAEPTYVLPKPIGCGVDEDGYLIDPQGERGVWLIVGNYRVTYEFPEHKILTQDIEVTAEHTDEAPLDLTTVVPTSGNITSSQVAQLNGAFASLVQRMMAAEGKVNEVLVRSGIQTLTNPTTIPTDGPARLDLVFTEPTTVAFAAPYYHASPDIKLPQAPGVTDLVLSIEGYEHVTWSGVAVHGTPDQSGVVWASALWRNRDSTWHLLCEQETSVAGGGNVRLHTFTKPLSAVRDKSPQELDSRGFVAQEAYQPFPSNLTFSDVVVDLENPAGGEPLTTYVNVPLRGGSIPGALTIGATEAVWRTPDNASYVKFTLTDFIIRGDLYALAYRVKIKGTPLRANTIERFDHPLVEDIKVPGTGTFVVSDLVDVPDLGEAKVTIARFAVAANSYVRVEFPSAPAASFPTEVVVTGSVEGHLGGGGRGWSDT